MTVLAYLKKVICICLISVAILTATAFSIDSTNQALAKPKTPEAAAYQVDRDSVDAYRNLQRATYAYRNEGLEGEGSQTGRLGNRVGLAERTAKKLQNRMDNRRDLSSQSNSVEDAAQNMVDNTQDAFERASGKVRRNLKMND